MNAGIDIAASKIINIKASGQKINANSNVIMSIAAQKLFMSYPPEIQTWNWISFLLSESFGESSSIFIAKLPLYPEDYWSGYLRLSGRPIVREIHLCQGIPLEKLELNPPYQSFDWRS